MPRKHKTDDMCMDSSCFHPAKFDVPGTLNASWSGEGGEPFVARYCGVHRNAAYREGWNGLLNSNTIVVPGHQNMQRFRATPLEHQRLRREVIDAQHGLRKLRDQEDDLIFQIGLAVVDSGETYPDLINDVHLIRDKIAEETKRLDDLEEQYDEARKTHERT